ncbi:MAG: hypothetical protein CL868_03950 [Cytophagaceae bacterium]|mgnify:CR=1 FL=1|nr:hypothetical protein [Cytophagaceae bacterium]
MTWGNYLLFGTAFENSVRVLNENGQVINYFNIEGSLHNWYSQFDSQGNLIMVGQFGDRIYTFNEYGWFRGFIHNYGTLNNILSVDDITVDNFENDFTIYPNPTSDVLNINIQNQNIEKIILYDISGKKLRVYNISSIDIKEFRTGLYIIKIHTKAKKVLTSKVIKI